MTPSEVNLGAVYTQPWVTEMLLDQVGYSADRDLTEGVLVEPCCGGGAFAIPIVDRLLQSAALHGVDPARLGSALVLADIDPSAVEASRLAVTATLRQRGVPRGTVDKLVDNWFRVTDFLSSNDGFPQADWVVGNPPYIRLEDVPGERRREYRALWSSMRGRADVFVGFWQAGLELLKPHGRIGFVCADRWMRNQYGRTLRHIVTTDYTIESILDLHDVDAFERRVDAYAAITVIRAESTTENQLSVGKLARSFRPTDAAALTDELVRGDYKERDKWRLWTVEQSSLSETGWMLGGPDASDPRLLAALPTLPETGVVVRGGIATGADEVFIVDGRVDVEAALLRPVVGPKDLIEGQLQWAGRYLIYPWTESRELIALDKYPRLAIYLHRHEQRLRERHVIRSRQNEDGWWRTIDREPVGGYSGKALLVPDIRERVEPVLDEGAHVPMHSLYRLTADGWDLDVLGGVLLSELVHTQMRSMSVSMASGRMRVSAQYLRRLRIPSVAQATPFAGELRSAFRSRDREAASVLVATIARAAST
ncbi:Eco57I restriction-modification methylase domain-containing protein [Curtobacterium sp. VKM Ac-1376]|uniref:Eco57I restriction-modification methylase domain-containing protein n=1 Tax=Curtobacterium sp. VKM Ac-1376 TaxID=123312 RepID=UPI00188B688A|nr:Eco57I restriction-modification methylase domain-containing protein [Curtobacterium sp. VKM Ac-1376]MBF4615467.1 Eco57I restriction-modification methylase domain-containing protein [Curtobacterium sp. VKM Ac-1376]